MPGFYKGLDELIASFKRSLVNPDMLRQISGRHRNAHRN